MSGYASGSVSMDQLVAEHIGEATRHASLQVTCGNPQDDARVSYTKEGLALPMVGRPSALYQTLFRSDSDASRIEYVLKSNSSIQRFTCWCPMGFPIMSNLFHKISYIPCPWGSVNITISDMSQNLWQKNLTFSYRVNLCYWNMYFLFLTSLSYERYGPL